MPFPNLATQFKSGETAVKMGSKGGRVRSAKKSLSAQIRRLREKGLSDENAARIYALMTDSDASALDIKLILERLKALSPDKKSQQELVRLLMDFHKMHHGTKEKNNEINVNVEKNELNITFIVPPELNDEHKNRADAETISRVETIIRQ